MFRHHRRLHASLRAVVAAAAIGAAASSQAADATVTEVEAAAQRLVDELLDVNRSKHRPPLISDAVHARTIDPVLTRDTAIWIHENLPAAPLTVMGGRVFTYSDAVYDPLDAPVLKIRPIDDDQVIPFLVRVVVHPDTDVTPESAVTVSFPAPPIFDPVIDGVSAWVGTRSTGSVVKARPADSRILVRVPLAGADIGKRHGTTAQLTVTISGELRLNAYKTLRASRFPKDFDARWDPDIAGLARLEPDRDVTITGQRALLLETAESLTSETNSLYERVLAINSWVSDHLSYQKSHATRSPLEALEDRSGDCDEYTSLMVALLRATGIPARHATGLLYDLDTLAAHAWVEVALPTRDNGIHWFVCDPTLAGTTSLADQKAIYVQLKERILLYPMRPAIGIEGISGRRTTDVLLNWRIPSGIRLSKPGELDRFIDLVTQSVDREISSRAERLAKAGLSFHRESASIAGSPYLLVDRPIAEESLSRLRLRLENEERMVLDLISGRDKALDSALDLESLFHLRSAYEELNALYFSDAPAHANLELVYIRNSHSDRLHEVSFRVGRYLVEHFLDRVLAKLVKHQLLTAEEVASILETAEVSGGKNLYIQQELARRHLEAD